MKKGWKGKKKKKRAEWKKEGGVQERMEYRWGGVGKEEGRVEKKDGVEKKTVE